MHIKQRLKQRFMLGLLILASTYIGLSAQAQTDNGDIVSVEAVETLDEDALRELVAPIALYPDDLLAIVLPASTYPLQIVAAARYREAAAIDHDLEPDEYWDESIVALLNYPEALTFLNADLNWTWELGQAVLAQQEDVLAAVSEFRDEAYAAGNLDSDDHQVVDVEDDIVTIKSADPEVVYVPYYEPEEVTVYQTERVYHYYPSAYPVYYYPYSYRHRFYNHHSFWGVSSIFLLSWDNRHVGYYNHNQSYHPFYRDRYHNNHFRRTKRYNSPRAHQRRAAHRGNKIHREHGRWRPNSRYAGSRQNYAERRRHRAERRDRAHKRERHTRRQAREQGSLTAFTRRGRHADRPGADVQRRPDREINAVRQSQARSSVHRPLRDVKRQAVKRQQAQQAGRLKKKRQQQQRQQRPQRQQREQRVRQEAPRRASQQIATQSRQATRSRARQQAAPRQQPRGQQRAQKTQKAARNAPQRVAQSKPNRTRPANRQAKQSSRSYNPVKRPGVPVKRPGAGGYIRER